MRRLLHELLQLWPTAIGLFLAVFIVVGVVELLRAGASWLADWLEPGDTR